MSIAGDLEALQREIAALRESEQLLRSAIDAIGDGFVLYDPEDRLVLCNEQYRQMYLSSAPAIEIGRTFEEIIRYGVAHGQYPQAVGREEAWIAERLAAHQAADNDIIQRLDDGNWLRIKEKRMPSGHIVGFRVDVTEIFRAKEAAEAANRAKSEFLANMSHEIRTPMNAVLGMTQLVLDSPLSDQQADYLKKSLNAGRALLGILNDILDYSKIEAGHLAIEQTRFSVRQVLHDLGALFSAQFAAKGLDLDIDITPDLPDPVQGDPLRLRQVLVNLVGNALKFTEHGRISICVNVEPASASAATDTMILRFAVKDSGIGIEPERLEHLFQPFSQADGSITRKYGGTGLGLAICRRLVRLMGGDICATGTPGAGATFSFSIRVGQVSANTDAISQPIPEKSTPTPRHFPGAHALLVEDNPFNQQVAAGFLHKLGISVTIAENGRRAIAEASQHHFDIVLMDMHMPVMDGLEATRRIHALPGCADLPVVAMTAAVMVEDRQRCREAGMIDFVPKPIEPDDLMVVLNRHLTGNLVLTTGAPSPTAGPPIPDMPGFDLPAALKRLGGDRALLEDLLADFLDAHAGFMTSLGEHSAKRDMHAAVTALHGLKGAAGNLGATHLAEVARTLESEFRAGNAPDLSILDAAIRHAQDVLVQLKTLPAAQPVLAVEVVTDLLEKLRPYLEERELAPDALLQQLAECVHRAPPGLSLARLQQQIDVFDHDGALATVCQIAAQLDINFDHDHSERRAPR